MKDLIASVKDQNGEIKGSGHGMAKNSVPVSIMGLHEQFPHHALLDLGDVVDIIKHQEGLL